MDQQKPSAGEREPLDLLEDAETVLDRTQRGNLTEEDLPQLLAGILAAATATARMFHRTGRNPRRPPAPPLLTKGPAAERALELQDLWDWANSHRLVVYGTPGGVVYSDVHLIGIRPHTIGRDRVQIAPGVYILGPEVSA